jgi:hypothetical protein
MKSKLLTYLKYEQQLMIELVSLAEKHREALIKFDVADIEKYSVYQEETAKSLNEVEQQRLAYFMSWLNISRSEAMNLHLSQVEQLFQEDEAVELRKIRKSMNVLVAKLNTFNSVNRVLANRARNSVREILSAFSSSSSVCNVKI